MPCYEDLPSLKLFSCLKNGWCGRQAGFLLGAFGLFSGALLAVSFRVPGNPGAYFFGIKAENMLTGRCWILDVEIQS